MPEREPNNRTSSGSHASPAAVTQRTTCLTPFPALTQPPSLPGINPTIRYWTYTGALALSIVWFHRVLFMPSLLHITYVKCSGSEHYFGCKSFGSES